MRIEHIVIPLLIVTLSACDADPDATPMPNDGACADGPTTTWANFGDGFVRTYCQGCHASTALERNGAPPSMTFDSAANVARYRLAIEDAATGEAPRMPPAGGVSAAERARLAFWLLCDSKLW